MYEEGSDTGPRGTFEIYRAEGDSLYKNGDYRKAIESYTTVSILISLHGWSQYEVVTI